MRHRSIGRLFIPYMQVKLAQPICFRDELHLRLLFVKTLAFHYDDDELYCKETLKKLGKSEKDGLPSQWLSKVIAG